MSKVTIEFDRVEDADDLRNALDGWKYKMFIWDLDQKLRSVHKHGAAIEGSGEATPEEMDVCYRIREYIRQELQDSNLTIE